MAATSFIEVKSSAVVIEENDGISTAIELLVQATMNMVENDDVASITSRLSISSDAVFSLGGYNFTKENSTNDAVAMQIVNGSGLTIRPGQTGNYTGGARTAPLVRIDMSQIIPSYNIFMPLRAWFWMQTFTTVDTGGSCHTLAAFESQTTNTTNLSFYTQRARTTSVGWGCGAVLAGSTTGNAFTADLASYDCALMTLPDGIFGRHAHYAMGTYNNGFPDLSAAQPLRIYEGFGSTVVQNTIVSGSSVNFVLESGRAGSTTELTAAFGRIRIDYRRL